MLSITGVSAEQAKTYYDRDNYYTREPGQWQGRGAEALGLTGEVDKEDFNRLLHGQDREGNLLIRSGVNGEHRAAMDLTFSAPKSVSILSEVAGDERVREAHARAVGETLRYIEEHYAQARQTENRQTQRVDTGNLVIAAFPHNTSRELDPQLHTHCVVVNATQREDGSWRALSNENLYEHKMLMGQIYRNELAANLKELGYGIETDQRGLFEVSGVDKGLMEHFSTRSEQIDTKVKELKESGQYKNMEEQKLREIAALGSRVAKKDVDPEALRQSWEERSCAAGFSREDIVLSAALSAERSAEQGMGEIVPGSEPPNNEYDYIRKAAGIINEQESVFTREELLRTSARLSLGERRIADLDRATGELLKDGDLVSLNSSALTTREMQKTERDILRQAQKSRGTHEPLATAEEAARGTHHYEEMKGREFPGFMLTPDQRDGVAHLLTSKDFVIGIQGDAGTGKTTLLDALRHISQGKGIELRGMSYTGKAASEIEESSRIPSSTIHRFLHEDSPGSAVPDASGNQKLWIVDEASMVGSRQTLDILKRAQQEKARVVLIGDTKQLQAIDAGRIFRDLQQSEAMTTHRMASLVRQTDPDYRAAVRDFSERNFTKAFDRLEGKKALCAIPDPAERRAAIRDKFLSVDPRKTVIVTGTNRDKDALNEEIRTALMGRGSLAGSEHSFLTREARGISPLESHFANEYRTGDILFARKAGVMGRAGAEARITAVDAEKHVLTVQTKEGRALTINLRKHGQAVTAYAEKTRSFSKGDKVVFLKNDKGLKVKNGMTGEIKSVDERGNMVIRMDGKKEVALNISNQYPYLSHGYAVTEYKAQGMTAGNVIYHADTRGKLNYNSLYVAMTRGKEGVSLYTDDKARFKEAALSEQQKTSTLFPRELAKGVDKGMDKEMAKGGEKGDEKGFTREIERDR